MSVTVDHSAKSFPKGALAESVRLRVMAELTDAKRRIIERLKRAESITASELAGEFGLTDTAIRQHLEALEAVGLVARTPGPAIGRGRPPVHWRVTPMAAELFPDRHADLTVELIQSIRQSLGEDALGEVIRTRRERQLAAYRDQIDPAADVAVKVRRLADIRTAEGYVAEATADGDTLVLTEHHCPIRRRRRRVPRPVHRRAGAVPLGARRRRDRRARPAPPHRRPALQLPHHAHLTAHARTDDADSPHRPHGRR